MPANTGYPADDEMLHAFRNPIRVFELDDLVMLIGADESGRMLEIGVAEDIEFIIHASQPATIS